MSRPGPECAREAQENQKRLARQGLPPCGRLMDPSCRFNDDIRHAADVIEEGKSLHGINPVNELVVASLVARIHGIGTQVVSASIERELSRRRGARIAARSDSETMRGILTRDARFG